MQFLRQVEANPATKVLATWYETSTEEHAQLLTELAAQLYIWPSHREQDSKTWRGRAKVPHPHGVGDFCLRQNMEQGSTYFIRIDPPGTAPSLF